MSATYNWTYRDGVPNKYNISIPAVADNVKPAGVSYVALFGNDATGNGSRQYPYRTLLKADANGGYVIAGGGVYRNENGLGNSDIYGDGDVIIDGFPYLNINPLGLFNVKLINMQKNFRIDNLINVKISGDNIVVEDCYQSTGNNYGNTYVNMGQLDWRHGGPLNSTSGYNTFIDIQNINLQITTYNGNNNAWGQLWFSIYDGCSISINDGINMDYCLFNNCSFRIGSSGAFTTISDLPTLIDFIQSAFPGNLSFAKSIFADPLFNNRSAGDYSLQQASPAKNMSYAGTYIGAVGVGMPIVARATESAGSFDFSTNVNLTVADDSITFTDDTMDAQIDTKPQFNSLGRVINAIPLYGFNADRNGQYVDTIPDLGAVLDAGDTMQQPASYLVVGGAITYNGSTYQPGDRLTTVSGTTTFITGVGGQVQEITEAPERHTVMARFQDGGVGPVTTASELTVGWWYFVAIGNADYGGTNYGDGQASRYFKCVSGTTGFTDASSSGVALSVETAMPDEATLAFQHYDPAFQPTTNNAGDVRTGAVLRGNGDPAYVRGTGNEWPINSKHMQFRYMFKHSNLTP